MLYAALIIMTVIVLAFVLVPLARGGRRAPARDAFARAVYRDQIAEVARDVERGIVDPAQAEATRREVARRLLAADTPDASLESKPRPLLAVALGTAVFLAAALLYALLGSPALPDRPFAGRAAERDVAAHRMPTDLNQAVAGLEAKLAANPDNVEGWLLLGRTEAMREHWQKAADAMRHAAELTRNRPDIAAGYGEVLVRAGGGLVTPAARDAFNAALAGEPDNPLALWYLGLAAVQEKKPAAARPYWQRLLGLLPADSDDRKLVAAALDALDKAATPR